MYSINNKIVNRMYGKGRGWCFTQKDFFDLGSPGAIRITLHRLEKKSVIRRITRGLYEYPKKHVTIGLLSPSPEKIIEALSVRDAIHFLPSGAYSANLLGLSEQVPAKIVFLTNGSTRRVKVGRQEIILKRTSPKILKAGKDSGMVILALKHLGKTQVKRQHTEHLKISLNNSTKRQLQKDRKYAPIWMQPIIDNIVMNTPC
ncbi:MAG: DUF6088 family protein [Candidatus Aminicenantes bacterium]|nr:DUF6088 family protein [Candidatus Aminicenantes bacterium]